ncbi:MAG: hypothetical protein MZV64_33615 [Ignavibacteriales bacterium]|nr:hypothetical protein [Ignavibacteriales bacterium]
MAFHQSAVTMTFFARDYTVPSVGQGDQPVVRPDRAPARLPVRRSGSSSLVQERLGQVWPASGAAASLRRLRRPGLPPLQRLRRRQSVPAPDVPALQPVLHRRPDAARRRPFRLAQQARARSPRPRARSASACSSRPRPTPSWSSARSACPSPKALGGLVAPAESQVSVYWLISTYFMLTIAELFLSPIGISFVSQGRPAQVQGPDAGRLVRGHGRRQLPRRGDGLVLDARAALGGLGYPGRRPASCRPPSSSRIMKRLERSPRP